MLLKTKCNKNKTVIKYAHIEEPLF